MISKTIGFRGLANIFRQTHMLRFWELPKTMIKTMASYGGFGVL